MIMMTKKKKYVIPFSSLKLGLHEFEFNIDSSFFEQLDYSVVDNGEFTIKVLFEKKETLFRLNFIIQGKISCCCDRCLDDLELPISGEDKLIVKFGEEAYQETEEIRVINEGDFELDVSSEIYQFISLLIPSKITHENVNDCNPIVIEKINNNSKQETESTDPRWEALSKLK